MTQATKYGLVTPLRPLPAIEAWDGTCETTLESSGGIVKRSIDEYGVEHIAIPERYRGELTIRRHIRGNYHLECHVTIGRDADLAITEELLGEGNLSFAVTVSSNSAAIKYNILQNLSAQSTAQLAYHAEHANGSLSWLLCCLGGENTFARVDTVAGSNTQTLTRAVTLGADAQQFDVHVATRHTGASSTSDMLTRSVLAGESRATYHGLIRIAEDAAGCDSYQKDEVILLSDRASADAIPDLEIHNHDVRCTHGASIGKLDDEKLFYLSSRGITEPDAKRMIAEGFLEPLLISQWQPMISERISRFSEKQA